MSIIDLDEYREHISGQAKCLDCKYEWVAVAPVGTYTLECPKCETMKGIWLYMCIRPEPHWVCYCDNEFFFVNENGIYCPKCGSWQTGL